MTRFTARMLFWAPRVLGLAVSLFIGLFALDAFSGPGPLIERIAAFAIHLIPAMVLLAIVAVAWRWEWVGGVAFVALAAVYAASVRGRLDWIAVISGPLLAVGLLFLWSWLRRSDLRAAR